MNTKINNNALVRLSHVLKAVIAPGLSVTAVVMMMVYLLNRWSDDANIMGWYADYIIPIGPLLVGALAGSGYCLFSWMTGVKVSRHLLWVIAGLQLLAYAVGQYEEFRQVDPRYTDGTRVEFVRFFDYMTQSFAWQEHGTPGNPLGVWGYAVRLLEIAGFVGGGVIPLLALSRRRYCDACQQYTRRKRVGLIAAGVRQPKLSKFGVAKTKFQADDEAAATAGQQMLEALRAAAASGNVDAVLDCVAHQRKERRAIAKSTRRIHVELVSCAGCDEGRLEACMHVGHGHSTKYVNVLEMPLSADMVRGLRGRIT